MAAKPHQKAQVGGDISVNAKTSSPFGSTLKFPSSAANHCSKRPRLAEAAKYEDRCPSLTVRSARLLHQIRYPSVKLSPRLIYLHAATCQPLVLVLILRPCNKLQLLPTCELGQPSHNLSTLRSTTRGVCSKPALSLHNIGAQGTCLTRAEEEGEKKGLTTVASRCLVQPILGSRIFGDIYFALRTN